MTITLYRTSDDPRKINKTLTEISTIYCTATEPCSLVKPQIILSGSANINAINANYAYISTFGRYYFIDDYTIDSAGRIIILLSIDVLYTYRAALLASTQMITRSESIGKSTMIPDNLLPLMPYKDTKVILFEGGDFNITSASGVDYNFVLNVAGGGSGQISGGE